jgi:HJR/Mrr/RecB family endonuclease
MSTAVLRHEQDAVRVAFSASVDGHVLPTSEWPQHLWAGPQPDCLFRLMDDGLVDETLGGMIVSNATMAALSGQEVLSLGLPPVAHLSVKLFSRGAITDPGARLEISLFRASGTPLGGWERTGVVLVAGGERYTVTDPLYTVLERIEAFNASSVPNRLAEWGMLQEVLPADATADDYLRGLRVGFASAFRLNPFINARNEPDFDVIPGRQAAGPGPDDPGDFEDTLPEARAEDFADRFRRLNARRQYQAGSGWYVVFSEPMSALVVALKSIQQSSPDDRRHFLINPHAGLRKLLPDEWAAQVEELFHDVGYSDRVIGIGLWAAKVLPWVKRGAEAWLPPEQFGIRIGESYVQIREEEIELLRTQVETAIGTGAPFIEYGGHRLPASRETLDALNALVEVSRPQPTESPPRRPEVPELAGRRVVLQIGANLDEIDYQPATRPRGPSIRHSAPQSLRTRLFPHQTEAVEWLQSHWTTGSPGALLADDMGLGKTLESLTFIAWVRELIAAGAYPRRPIAIVAPTGLLENWKQEVDRHLDDSGLGRLVEAYGSGLKQLRQSSEPELHSGLPALDMEVLRKADWVLTTYETWRDYQHSFGRVQWSVGVFDEVQKVKNPGALITESAKTINADFKLALTGTPVENRLADLWSITDLVQPGRLGALRDFSRRYETPNAADATESIGELKAILLSSNPAPMMRRLKETHIEGLPEKAAYWLRSDMPVAQAEAYRQVVENARVTGGGSMLQALGQLRSISLHPGIQGATADAEYIGQSARLSAVFEILDRVHEAGEKALVFLESREMQSALIGLVQRRYRAPARPMVVNGAVAGKVRQERVNEFQNRAGFDVMILSPKAGGVGLTLTSANHVIHLSRWWNPAVEDQCTDRAFRIGQHKKVSVYHPIAVHPDYGEHSFDVTLDQLLLKKRAMSQAVLSPTALSAEDIKELYRATLDVEGASLLEEIDCFEPLQFERWVFDRLQRGGFRVNATPRTHDRGADAIAHKIPSGRPLLIQIKHTQQSVRLGPDAIREVVAARQAYPLPNPARLLVVTNASGFTRDAQRLALAEDVRLVARGELLHLVGVVQ